MRQVIRSLAASGLVAASVFLSPLEVLAETEEQAQQEETPHILNVFIVSTYQGKTGTNPKYAKAGEEVALHAIVEAEINGKKDFYAGQPLPQAVIGNKKRTIKKLENAGKVNIEWFKVEAERRSYDHTNGGWKSDPVTYAETPFANGWSVPADAHPTKMRDEFPKLSTGVGVMRYKAVISDGKKTFSSPGAECIALGGICRSAHKVTYRLDENKYGPFLSRLSEMFNTPYIWGNTPYEAEQQIGSDCADFAIKGWRGAGNNVDYTWSQGLLSPRYTKKIHGIDKVVGLDTEGFFVDGAGRRIPIGENGIKPGDLFIYSRHVAVFWEDHGVVGYLDKNDLGVHTLFDAPGIEEIPDIFGVNFKIRRLKEKKL